ncbi:MAG: DNA-binding protein [Thiotrichales bacterium]|nr:MAG: DNA-binding protein [Thiotrichales bacterium]
MNKKEFKEYIANKFGISQREAEEVINKFTDATTSALSDGEIINLPGFGSYYITELAAREGRNPKTGEKIRIKASRAVKFRAGKRLKTAVN